MEISEFEKICQQEGLDLIKQDSNEIIEYGKILNGHVALSVEWSDCMEDDYSKIFVSLGTVYASISGFCNDENCIERTDRSWLEAKIKSAKESLSVAKEKLNTNYPDMTILAKVMSCLSLNEKERLSKIKVNLGKRTLGEIYELAKFSK
jgi:hypothetical protein